MTWEQFEEQFKPVQNTVSNREEFNGWLFETYGADYEHIVKLAKTQPRKVWTLIDAEDDIVIVSGWHFVNRLGYIITENEFADGEEIEVSEF